MLFLCGLPILGILVAVWYAWHDRWSTVGDTFVWGFLGGLGGLLAGIIVPWFIGATILSYEYKSHGEIELVALRNTDGMEGRVYVRGGYVSSAPYFLYYVKTPEGYRPGQARADSRVLIREEKRDDARLHVSCRALTNRSSRLWGFEVLQKDDCRYVFTVPEGTVQRGFSVQ